MNQDLGALKNEIAQYVAAEGMIVFHSYLRHHRDISAIGWDTKRYPDYREFVSAAKRAGVTMVVIRCEEFSAGDIEEALSELDDTELENGDRRRLERRLREFSAYEGFVSCVELSYDYQGREYFFDLRTEWYEDFLDLREEIFDSLPEEDPDDGGPVGGYYSRN